MKYSIDIDSSLIESLQTAQYPMLLLANSVEDESVDTEEIIKSIIESIPEKADIIGKSPVLVDEKWDDEALKDIDHESNSYGLIIAYISYTSKECLYVRLATQYSPEEAQKLKIRRNIGHILHARCYMTADLTEPIKQLENATPSYSSMPEVTDTIEKELSYLNISHSLLSNDNLSLYLFQGHEAPEILNQIGIAREITFQAIGAGSGNAIDISKEDHYYHHLMLWDKNENSLVGAYRIGFTESIIADQGEQALYLNQIFEIKPEFHDVMGNAMELSRSFILPHYQKNPQMLDTLWKGLGLSAKAKQCFTLYGSVTISEAFTPLSKSILVGTLHHHHSDKSELRELVTAKQPFTSTTKHHHLTVNAWADLGVNRLNSLIEEVESNQRSIPPLIRYYVGLGAKFLSFHIEASFNDAIYCLLRVDLKQLPKRYKKRFLGD